MSAVRRLLLWSAGAATLAGLARFALRRFRLNESKPAAWGSFHSGSLNATELPASAAARSQHEQPMQRSEELVDPAMTNHTASRRS